QSSQFGGGGRDRLAGVGPVEVAPQDEPGAVLLRDVREEVEDENVPRAGAQRAAAGTDAVAPDLAGRLDDQPIEVWLEPPHDSLGHPGARRVLVRAERRFRTAWTVAEQRL